MVFFLATTTLLRAAEEAPDHKRQKFVTLVEELQVGEFEVQDLLDEGKLWSLLQGKATEKGKELELGAFFDFWAIFSLIICFNSFLFE